MKTLRLILGAMVVLTSGLIAGEIDSDQLIDGYIIYTGKAMSPKKDEQITVTDEMRKQVVKLMGKEHPLFAPYTFEGMTFDRGALIKEINKAL